MRLAVLADVHANRPALEAVLAEVTRHRVDGLLVAGDYVGGPFADETILALRAAAEWMILGNTDINLLQLADARAPDVWRTHKQYALARWILRTTSPESLAILRALPEQLVLEPSAGAHIRLLHGSPHSPFDGLDPQGEPEAVRQTLHDLNEMVLVCAHTHVPWVARHHGKLALNPGAVCGPLNGDTRAQYALLILDGDEWRVEHHAVDYDHRAVRNAFAHSGLLEEGGPLARAFLLSIETGQDVALEFLVHAGRLAAAKGAPSDGTIPDEYWDRAELTFGWPQGTL